MRLSDVAPDGASTRVTYGLLNLTHRDGHEQPRGAGARQALPRDASQLNDIAHAFPPGHRIRVAVSTSLLADGLALAGAGHPDARRPAPARSTLPVRAPRAEDAKLRPFGPPESATPWNVTEIEPGTYVRRVERNDVTGEACLVMIAGGGMTRFNDLDGWEVGSRTEKRFSIRDGDPTSARIDIHTTWHFRRPGTGFDVRSETRSTLACTKDDWVFWADLEAFENGRRVHAKTWDATFPRDLN